MNAQGRLQGFTALVKDHQTSRSYFEEPDGSLKQWGDLSAQAKLSYVAIAAAIYNIPFPQFAGAVRELIGDPKDAALRLVLNSQRELHGLAELLPDDGRTEATPLVERFKEILNYESDRASETPEIERERGIEM